MAGQRTGGGEREKDRKREREKKREKERRRVHLNLSNRRVLWQATQEVRCDK
jgi:hypothetical protein